MSNGYKRLKGFADLYGQEMAAFSQMENTAKAVFSRYGFKELRPPLLEATELFQRSIGTETDVVKKEMFTFPDRKGRFLTLRPEATAGVLRACAENGLVRSGSVTRVFTIGPMFRYERPQKGRMRQFHQINCECLGAESPFADAELICMLLDFLKRLGLNKLTLKLNSLGCKNCRAAYHEKLSSFLQQLDENELCEDCRIRAKVNPLRVLDCKQAKCRELTAEAPKLLDNNCPDCQKHFNAVLELLASQNIGWEIDHHLVRGLDYYKRVTFEVVSDEIGAQTAVAGGGRYDGLLGQLGGPDLPGAGFACGMERLALLMAEAAEPGLDFYLLALEDRLLAQGFVLAENLRRQGFSGEINYRSGSMKSLMRQVSHSGAKFCLLLGSEEANAAQITVKNMGNGEQFSVEQINLATALGQALAK